MKDYIPLFAIVALVVLGVKFCDLVLIFCALKVSGVFCVDLEIL